MITVIQKAAGSEKNLLNRRLFCALRYHDKLYDKHDGAAAASHMEKAHAAPGGGNADAEGKRTCSRRLGFLQDSGKGHYCERRVGDII